MVREKAGRKKVTQMLRRMLNRQLASAFVGWASFARWKARTTAILMRVVNAKLSVALNSWCHVVANEVRNREILTQALVPSGLPRK